MLDSQAAMVRFLQSGRLRAGHLQGAADARLLEVGGDRGRPQVHPGQGHRQFDLDEGRRGEVPRTGAAGAALRRGGDRHGLRRAGPGRHLRSARPRSASAPTTCWSADGFPAEDIIFDPNIFAIATGIPEHDNYAVDFIEATRWIKQNLPHAGISGGISNVSFSFRGNEPVREAIHTVFLYHAIKAGLTMGIVNAGQLGVYDELDPVLREKVEDVVLNRKPGAGEALVEFAQSGEGAGQGAGRRSGLARVAGRQAPRTRDGPRHHRIRRGRYRGMPRRADGRRQAAAGGDRRPADGRHERGRRPVRRRQDVPAAGGEIGARHEAGRRPSRPLHRGGKDAAPARRPRARSSSPRSRATCTTSARTSSAWCSRCNGYEVVDLGVMVPADKILHAAKEHRRAGRSACPA